MRLVEIQSATRRFGSTSAVDSVSLTVESGEVVGLVGANGAGKTTLIRMLLGLLSPTSGRINLFGGPAGSADRHAIGYVPQSLGLYRNLTVSENLQFTARAFGVPVPPLDPELAAVADRGIGQIPLGLRRRLAFTAARCHKPALLVLDEPTSGVGQMGRVGLWDTIHQAADEGTGVLVTTHYMEEAEQCDRVIVMAFGRQVAMGPVSEIVAGHFSIAVTGLDGSTVDRLTDAGLTVFSDGSSWRIANTDEGSVKKVLGPDFPLKTVAATFEETFVRLAALDE